MLNYRNILEKEFYNTDLRIAKTHKALSKALLTLLVKQSFGQIKVTDICEEALVSRSSFYSHFEDKYYLLLFCFEEIKETLKTESEKSTNCEEKESFVDLLLMHIQNNSQLFKSLFVRESNLEVRRILEIVVSREVILFLSSQEKKVALSSNELEHFFLIGGINHIIYSWIESDCALAVSEVSSYLHEVCIKVID